MIPKIALRYLRELAFMASLVDLFVSVKGKWLTCVLLSCLFYSLFRDTLLRLELVHALGGVVLFSLGVLLIAWAFMIKKEFYSFSLLVVGVVCLDVVLSLWFVFSMAKFIMVATDQNGSTLLAAGVFLGGYMNWHWKVSTLFPSLD